MTTHISQNSSISFELKCFAISAMIITAFTISPELAEAATATASAVKGDKELGTALHNITGLVAGNVGKIIAIVSFMFGLIGSIFKFNPAAIGGSFGVAMAAGLGPQLIESVVGATF